MGSVISKNNTVVPINKASYKTIPQSEKFYNQYENNPNDKLGSKTGPVKIYVRTNNIV